MADYLETDLAYIAGLVDGEGHICILSANNETSFTTQLGISNTDREILDWIQGIFDGYIYDKQKIKGRKQGYQIRWNKQVRIKEILTLLLPYLRIKKIQALMVLEFIDICKGNRINKLSSEEIDTLEELHYGVSLSNRRGE